MHRYILPPLICLLLIAPAVGAAPLTVASFLASPPASGTAELAGFVISKYACPPCPRGAYCKPCQGDHLVIADTPAPDASQTLMVLCEAAALAGFDTGKRYRFQVELRGVRSTLPFVGELHLRSAEVAPVQ